MAWPGLSELDYLREIERLANAVASAAAGEDWYGSDGGTEDPLLRSINALGRALRSYHFAMDGCVDEGADRPRVKLAGVVILRPEAMPIGMSDTYEQACRRLGVEARPEGWALWNTWGDGNLKVTMVVTAVDTTEGLLQNWANGRSVLPVLPVPSQIAQVHEGWIGSPIFSPYGKKKLGLDGNVR